VRKQAVQMLLEERAQHVAGFRSFGFWELKRKYLKQIKLLNEIVVSFFFDILQKIHCYISIFNKIVKLLKILRKSVKHVERI